MEISHNIVEMAKVHFEVTEGGYTFQDTILVEKATLDAMSEEERKAYVEARFAEWKEHMINPISS